MAGEAITDVVEAKRRAVSRLGRWDSPKDGRFVVALGYGRFEAWGGVADGFIVHIASDGRDLEALAVLSRVPHQDDEVAVALNTHGLTGWVREGVQVPGEVAERALNGFFEAQGAKDLKAGPGSAAYKLRTYGSPGKKSQRSVRPTLLPHGLLQAVRRGLECSSDGR